MANNQISQKKKKAEMGARCRIKKSSWLPISQVLGVQQGKKT